MQVVYPMQTKLESGLFKEQGGIQICFKSCCELYDFPK